MQILSDLDFPIQQQRSPALIHCVTHKLCKCKAVSMKNITVSVDEETHRQARIRAAELGTSVSGLVRTYLKALCAQPMDTTDDGSRKNETELERRYRLINEVIESITANGGGLRMSENLTREELYDDAIRSRGAIR